MASTSPIEVPPLRSFLAYFLRLGTFGFGGPIALAGYMQRDLVEDRRWIAKQDYVEGLALAQLAPRRRLACAPVTSRFPLIVAFALLAPFGCKRTDARLAVTVDAAAPPSAPAVPSFRAAVLPHIRKRCAEAEGCHGPKPTDSVDLDLRPAAAYEQLVNHAAQARKGALRIKPGDVAGSFLVDKLTGGLRKREGKTMPIDADTGAPIEPVPTDPAFVEQVLKPWIVAGAPNN